MLGGGPWTEGAKFPSVTAMIDADLEHFLGLFGFTAIPPADVLGKLCRSVWDTIPPSDRYEDHGRQAQESLLLGNMINTRVTVWLLRGFAAHCGFKMGYPGCDDEDAPTALKCRVHMDRKAC